MAAVKDIAVVFDCGATNIRVAATDIHGRILSSASEPNSARPDPQYAGCLIWDIREIWARMCRASKKVMSEIPRERIAAVTVTTFGVDGTLLDRNGKMLFPVISWQCGRTQPIADNIHKYISKEELYEISGVLPFGFNTLFKQIWFMENHPELVEKAKCFLFMPSLFGYFLTGEMVNDITMAGTSMTTDILTRSWSERIYNATGFPAELMLQPAEPGTLTGRITAGAEALTSVPTGTPVIATGHDTQFALFGAGAGVNTPVLSSGTWEILMVRAASCNTGNIMMRSSITTELDVRRGLYDIGNQWIASGLIEWVRKRYYAEVADNVYDVMIAGATEAPESCRGVTVTPDFSKPDLENAIHGINATTTRDDIFRALLTALAERLRQGRERIEKAGNFNTSTIICVGGGSRNRLWNQMRADATGAVLRVSDASEATVTGAAAFAHYGAGNAPSPEEAMKEIKCKTTEYFPRQK